MTKAEFMQMVEKDYQEWLEHRTANRTSGACDSCKLKTDVCDKVETRGDFVALMTFGPTVFAKGVDAVHAARDAEKALREKGGNVVPFPVPAPKMLQ